MGCPIRISPDQRLFAPPRSFSQLVTSFFASESQGIHLSLLSNFYLIVFVLELLFVQTHSRASLHYIVFSYVYLPSMSKIVNSRPWGRRLKFRVEGLEFREFNL